VFSRQFVYTFTAAAMAAAVCAGPARSAETKLSAADKKIIEGLRSLTVIEFVEVSLQDVVDYLKDYHKVEIQFDQKALGDAGIKTSVRVTRRVKGVTLHGALRLILGQAGMVHVIRDEALLITTPERGRQLVQAGAIDPAGYCQRAAAGQKIAEALKKPVSLEAVDLSLEDVVDFLRDYCKVEIQIDHRALAAARVRTDVPRTLNVKEVSLETALRLLLRDLALAHVAEEEWILITAAPRPGPRATGARATDGTGRSRRVTEEQHRLIEGEIRRIVQQMKVFRKGEETAPLELLPGPLLRFEVEPVYVYGTVWAWGGPGRPQAVFSLVLYGSPDHPLWLQEIVSLSDKPVCASAWKRTWWAAETPAWKPKPIASSAAPAQDRQGRLLQMKALSTRFTGWEYGRAGRPWGLERLADPVYRCAAQTGGTLDGAIFVFAARGDNPEILLAIDAEKATGGQAQWKYGAAPLAANGLILKLDNQECWRQAWSDQRRTRPSDPYHLRTVSAAEEIRRTEGKADPSEPLARDPFAP
jgi:hypothetical protein